jgi:hypothetical protein
MTTATLGKYTLPYNAGKGTFPFHNALKAEGLRWNPESKVWHTDDQAAFERAHVMVTGQKPGQNTQGTNAAVDGGSDGPGADTAGESTGEAVSGEQQAQGQVDVTVELGSVKVPGDATGATNDLRRDFDDPRRDVDSLNDRELTKVMQAVRQATGIRMGDPARRTPEEEAAGKTLTDAKRDRIVNALPNTDERRTAIQGALGAGQGQPQQAPGKPGEGKPGNGKAPGAGQQTDKKVEAEKQAQQVFGPAGVQAIQSLVEAGLDEDRVREIAREEDAAVIKATADALAALQAAIKNTTSDVAAQPVARTEVVFKAPQTPEGVVSTGMHYQAPMVAALLLQGANVGLVGKPGIGKTHLASDVGKLTGWGFAGSDSCTGDMTSAVAFGRLLPIGEGRYLPANWLEAFEKGGVHLWDEADAMPGEIQIGMNGALANGYVYVPTRAIAGLSTRVDRSPTFGGLFGMNTFATGATAEYTARQGWDAASRDRLILIEMTADQRVVAHLFGASAPIGAQKVWTPDKEAYTVGEADAWYAWYLAVGSKLDATKKRATWSPRVGQKVQIMRQAGLRQAEVTKVLFAGWKPDTLAALDGLAQGPAFA